MKSWSTEDLQGMRGETVYSSDDQKIGKVEDIWVDDTTGEPAWVGIGTGVFRSKHVLVPVQGATMAEDGVRVAWTKDHVKDAPDIDEGHISPQTEQELYGYYDLRYGEVQAQGAPARETTARGKDGADAMTRSEEEVDVQKSRRPAEKVRLRKYVVTEQVQQTVPVKREEVRVEREPITEGNRDEAMSGPEISEGEHEVTLMEEKVTPQKRVVPKERVRLEKDTSTDEEQVSEEVRKEQITVERDKADRRKR